MLPRVARSLLPSWITMPSSTTHSTRSKNHHPAAQAATRKRGTASRARPRSITQAKREAEQETKKAIAKASPESFFSRSASYGLQAARGAFSELKRFGQLRPMIALGIGALVGGLLSRSFRS